MAPRVLSEDHFPPSSSPLPSVHVLLQRLCSFKSLRFSTLALQLILIFKKLLIRNKPLIYIGHLKVVISSLQVFDQWMEFLNFMMLINFLHLLLNNIKIVLILHGIQLVVMLQLMCQPGEIRMKMVIKSGLSEVRHPPTNPSLSELLFRSSSRASATSKPSPILH